MELFTYPVHGVVTKPFRQSDLNAGAGKKEKVFSMEVRLGMGDKNITGYYPETVGNSIQICHR